MVSGVSKVCQEENQCWQTQCLAPGGALGLWMQGAALEHCSCCSPAAAPCFCPVALSATPSSVSSVLASGSTSQPQESALTRCPHRCPHRTMAGMCCDSSHVSGLYQIKV